MTPELAAAVRKIVAGDSATRVAADAVQACEQLSQHLARLIGEVGVRTLLAALAYLGGRTLGSTYLRAQFTRLKAQRGAKKAIVAVAASMLTAAFHIIRDRVVYRELGADNFTKRDPAKAAKRLLKRLEELGYAVEARPTTAVVSI